MKDKQKKTWSFSTLSAEQKAIFVLLMVLGVGGFVLGFKSFAANIRRPFQAQLAEYAKSGKYLTQDEKEDQRMKELKQKDSDSDGLTDYDELHVFKTSPYIADSDSDGYNDKTEVYSNNDPNCPEGEDCSVATKASAEEAGDDSVDPETLTSQAPGSSGGSLLPEGGMGTDMEALKKAGVDVDQLNAITNGELSEQLGQTQTGEESSASNETIEGGGELAGLPKLDFESADDVKEFFAALTPSQIRQAMSDAGIAQEKIDQLSDEQVRAVFDKAIETAEENGQLESFINQVSK